MNKAFELWSRAAELGSVRANYIVGFSYYENGNYSSVGQKKKGVHHLKRAAMDRCVMSRDMLGVIGMVD